MLQQEDSTDFFLQLCSNQPCDLWLKISKTVEDSKKLSTCQNSQEISEFFKARMKSLHGSVTNLQSLKVEAVFSRTAEIFHSFQSKTSADNTFTVKTITLPCEKYKHTSPEQASLPNSFCFEGCFSG